MSTQSERERDVLLARCQDFYALQSRLEDEQRDPRRRDSVYRRALAVVETAITDALSVSTQDIGSKIADGIDNTFLMHEISLRTADTADKIIIALLQKEGNT